MVEAVKAFRSEALVTVSGLVALRSLLQSMVRGITTHQIKQLPPSYTATRIPAMS